MCVCLCEHNRICQSGKKQCWLGKILNCHKIYSQIDVRDKFYLHDGIDYNIIIQFSVDLSEMIDSLRILNV